MSLIIILAGLVVVLIGFLFYKKHKDLKKVCTTQTTGKVIDIRREEKVSTETDSDGHTRKTTSINYFPKFQYFASGKTFEKESTVGTNRPRFTKGQDINVMFNPINSEQFYVVEDKAAGRFGVYFMIFGAAILIIGIVTIFVPISSL